MLYITINNAKGDKDSLQMHFARTNKQVQQIVAIAIAIAIAIVVVTVAVAVAAIAIAIAAVEAVVVVFTLLSSAQ